MEAIQIGGRRYECYTVRGRVAAGAGDREGLWIHTTADPPHQLRLGGWRIAPTVGHEVSVVWLVPAGGASGPYVALRDHTSGVVLYNGRALAMLARPAWPLLAATALALGVTPVTTGIVAAGLAAWWAIGEHRSGRLMAAGALWEVLAHARAGSSTALITGAPGR